MKVTHTDRSSRSYIVAVALLCLVGATLGKPGTISKDSAPLILRFRDDNDHTEHRIDDIDNKKSIKLAQGSPALDDQFPFAASLEINGVHACGGVLIRPKVILTAGHCVTNFEDGSLKTPETMKVQIGNVIRGQGTRYPVEQVVIPEVFSLNSSFLGDIALLELLVPVNENKATLMDDIRLTNNSLLTAIGWGHTSDLEVLSTSLLQTRLVTLPEESCGTFHQIKDLGEKPIDHFCAGGMNSGADTCRGDSGGPLLEGDFHVVGITSYGASDAKCGGVNSTGVYTSVPFWYPWINDTLSLYNMDGYTKPDRLVIPDFNTCWEFTKESDLIFDTPVDSVRICADNCRNNSECLSWQWDFQTGRCQHSAELSPPVVVGEACHTGKVVPNVDRLLAT